MTLNKKSKPIEDLLCSLLPKRGTGVCAFCGSDEIKDEDFTDDISRSEFRISGFCQVCQDDTFSEED